MYDGLSPDRVILSGNYLSIQKLHPHDVGYYVIKILKSVMAKWYVCNALTHCTTLNTSVTELAPCVQRHHPVQSSVIILYYMLQMVPE